MTREELREHCEKQIENCEMWAKYKGEEPHGKVYEEHKLILELLGQEVVSKESYDHEYFLRKEFEMKIDKLEQQEPILDKIRDEILKLDDADYDFDGYYKAVTDALKIIDKYRGER